MNKNLKPFLEEINRTHSMSEAARVLFVSQPYISQTLRKSEGEFGVSLTHPVAGKITLTYAGQRLLDYLIQEDKNLLRLKKEMTEIASYTSGVIRVGTNKPLGHYLLPSVLPKFNELYPKLQVKLLELTTEKANYLLNNDELDVFLGLHLEKKGLSFIPVVMTNSYLVVSNQTDVFDPELVGKEIVLPDAESVSKLIDGQNYIELTPDTLYQQQVSDFFMQQKIRTNTIAVVPDFDLATELVKYHLGMTVTTNYVIDKYDLRKDDTVNIYRLPENLISLDMGISYKSDDDAAINQMVDLIMNFMNTKKNNKEL
ncbi:LysR family transcriptional regulator [Secundilactobacillus collinoides]|uniref:HTH lysR-type domain-containing protein n=2 Tax=Secundilactobacillus collinoides TaxID=33960 RepID=A0A166GFF1_SECCO|nr:LysR family transcriptional regulator [Secundilactobacillus collinoides]KZL38895.1 hypothetical protein TY91_11345 [Secundilactobacillus collinoides]